MGGTAGGCKTCRLRFPPHPEAPCPTPKPPSMRERSGTGTARGGREREGRRRLEGKKGPELKALGERCWVIRS